MVPTLDFDFFAPPVTPAVQAAPSGSLPADGTNAGAAPAPTPAARAVSPGVDLFLQDLFPDGVPAPPAATAAPAPAPAVAAGAPVPVAARPPPVPAAVVPPVAPAAPPSYAEVAGGNHAARPGDGQAQVDFVVDDAEPDGAAFGNHDAGAESDTSSVISWS